MVVPITRRIGGLVVILGGLFALTGTASASRQETNYEIVCVSECPGDQNSFCAGQFNGAKCSFLCGGSIGGNWNIHCPQGSITPILMMCKPCED